MPLWFQMHTFSQAQNKKNMQNNKQYQQLKISNSVSTVYLESVGHTCDKRIIFLNMMYKAHEIHQNQQFEKFLWSPPLHMGGFLLVAIVDLTLGSKDSL
jgi:hypothetical protein